MQPLTLIELMVELNRRLTGRPPTEEFVDAIRRLREGYDLEDDTKVPGWLTDAFGAALEGRETGKVHFERIGSDVDSFLSEVSELISGWEHDDQGESIGIGFPALGVKIHLSREERNPAGESCCAYKVTRTRGRE
jgi:hypothetical protein